MGPIPLSKNPVFKKLPSLNSFQLKIIASALMVLDHLRQFMPFMPLWFRYLGRIVAPIFFFLITEGFFHTRSKARYIARLFGAGLLMSLGSGILTELFPTSNPLYNNIFFSLALGVALIWALEWSKTTGGRRWAWLVILLVLGASLFTEAHLYGVMMILVFYFYRGQPRLLATFYSLGALLPTLTGPLNFHDLLYYDYQWMMVLAIPFFFAYNGEPGPRTPLTKWFFYIFYPVHLWVIYVLSYLAL